MKGDTSDESLDVLSARIVARHANLPKQLQLISRFLLDHPQRAALMTIADLSAERGVQPSSVIRFSKAVGYSGFSEIQRLLRTNISDQLAGPLGASPKDALDDHGHIGRFTALAQQSLRQLPSEGELGQAADIMLDARIVHVLGMRASFGLASSFVFMMTRIDAPAHLLNPVGQMTEALLSTVTAEDVVLGISFPDYASLTLDIATVARKKGAKFVALTDSAVSPIAKEADVLLLADQATDGVHRSGAGSWVTLQALSSLYAQRAVAAQARKV